MHNETVLVILCILKGAHLANQVQLSHLEQTAYFAALRQGLHVLDVERMSRLIGVSNDHALKLLATMARKGALQRVGRGRYLVIPADILYGRQSFVADPFQVIADLMQRKDISEYYVAYQSAALVYGAVSQLPQALMVATPRQHRPVRLDGAEIIFVQVQRVKFFGSEEVRYHDALFAISNREKTLLDCLDRYDLCGGIDEVAQTITRLLPEINTERLLAYAARMNNRALIQRLGFILQEISTDPPATALLDGLTALVSPRVYLLDPHGPTPGAIDPRWRVRHNIALTQDLTQEM